ncbi:MAG: ribosome small subunit-dependent GTPase A [Armatimonadota bacterium]|nr:ribosome small subunit-dependent GTPase A [Armatimonadota bacterium]
MCDGPAKEEQAPALLADRPDNEAPVEKTGRVLAVHGEQSLVDVDGSLCHCALSGRLKHQRKDTQPVARAAGSWQRNSREVRGRWERSRNHAPPSSPVAVGDQVVVRVDVQGNGVVLERLERKSWLGRMRPTKGPQVIAANVEVALVVLSVARPEPDFFLLDQFLVQAAAGGMEPWIVFNKIDLLDEIAPVDEDEPVFAAPRFGGSGPAANTGSRPEGLHQLSPDEDELDADSPSLTADLPLCRKIDAPTVQDDGGAEYHEAAFYRKLGYPVFCTSALSARGITTLEESLQGRTAVLAGPSGVGKSHLLNHLAPKADARLGEISEWSGRGQHTTTHVAMYPLRGGGYLVDAPGIRRLELWQVAAADLVSFFPEFESHAANCDYRACSHLNETDCAVRAAAESGILPWRRYRHYREMRINSGP